MKTIIALKEATRMAGCAICGLIALGGIIAVGSAIGYCGLYLILDLGHSGPIRGGWRSWLGWGVVLIALSLTAWATFIVLAAHTESSHAVVVTQQQKDDGANRPSNATNNSLVSSTVGRSAVIVGRTCVAGGLIAGCLILLNLSDRVLDKRDWSEAEKCAASTVSFVAATGCGFWAVRILVG